VAANKEMICPMELRIKNFKVRGMMTLVISKHRGVTLAFKNDPLEAVEVSSSFDSIPSTRRFLQSQIEGQVLFSFHFFISFWAHNHVRQLFFPFGQLRNLLLETLPKIVHNISVSHKGGGKDTDSKDGISDDDSLESENMQVFHFLLFGSCSSPSLSHTQCFRTIHSHAKQARVLL